MILVIMILVIMILVIMILVIMILVIMITFLIRCEECDPRPYILPLFPSQLSLSTGQSPEFCPFLSGCILYSDKNYL